MKIVCDVETTGFQYQKHDVIQIGAVILNKYNKIEKTFSCFLRPERPESWTIGAEKAHGIPMSQAMTFPERRKSLLEFMQFIFPYINFFPLEFIYHANKPFDFDFMKHTFGKELLHSSFQKAFTEEKLTSTMHLFKDVVGNSVKKKGLKDICNYWNIELDHHNALNDAIATAKIYEICMRTLEFRENNTLFEAEECL